MINNIPQNILRYCSQCSNSWSPCISLIPIHVTVLNVWLKQYLTNYFVPLRCLSLKRSLEFFLSSIDSWKILDTLLESYRLVSFLPAEVAEGRFWDLKCMILLRYAMTTR